MSVLMADSCCMTENHKILESNYPSIKKKKKQLYTCEFLVHVPLKPSLKDFEHNLVLCEMSAAVR